MVRRGDMMTIEDIIDILAIELVGVIPDDENIIISTNRGEPAVADAKSHAGLAYRNVTRRIMGEEVPFLDLTAQQNLLSKMKKLFGFKPA
jgi:septum site-determining protein MinD